MDKQTNEPKRIFLKHKNLNQNEIKELNETIKLINELETKKQPTTKHKILNSKLNDFKIYKQQNDLNNIEYSKIFNNDCLIHKELLKNETINNETIKHYKLNELLNNQNEVKLLIEYNKINSIGLNNLNIYEDIQNESLKQRLIIEFINDFKTNLNQKNINDIKTLNYYFMKQKATNETKNLFNFIID